MQDAAAGLTFHGTGKLITPMGAKVLRISAVPEGRLIGLDRNYALELVKAGDVNVEYDKLIDRQLERAAITTISGYAKIFPDASQVLALKEAEYVTAARALGASNGRIIKKHLLTNCIGTLIVTTTLQIPSSIFTESFMSFLGIGVAVPLPSLGSLATDALNGMNTYPYLLFLPAILISVIILSFNLLGDGLRDAFDPKLKD